MKVIFSFPTWIVGGVNVFSANLARGLKRYGVDSTFVITWPFHHSPIPEPKDLDFVTLPLEPREINDVAFRWKMLREFLESNAPCIYMPGFDYMHSVVAGQLSDKVKVVGVVNSDMYWEYDHVKRLARYWNALVAVSRLTAEKTTRLAPPRLRPARLIHYGIPVPPEPPARDSDSKRPLKIIYAGRIDQHQKRILDLIDIVKALERRRVPAVLTVAGTGFQFAIEKEFMRVSKPFVDSGLMRFTGPLPNEEMPAFWAGQDAFVLTSRFEGMSLSLLEAMASGCVPVVTDVKSGTPELIRHGENGYRVPIGNIGAFADCLERLYRDGAERRRLSLSAHQTVRQGDYSIEQMSARYYHLFQEVLQNPAAPPRDGKILLPPDLLWAYRRHRLRGRLHRALQATHLLGPAKSARTLVRRMTGASKTKS